MTNQEQKYEILAKKKKNKNMKYYLEFSIKLDIIQKPESIMDNNSTTTTTKKSNLTTWGGLRGSLYVYDHEI